MMRTSIFFAERMKRNRKSAAFEERKKNREMALIRSYLSVEEECIFFDFG